MVIFELFQMSGHFDFSLNARAFLTLFKMHGNFDSRSDPFFEM